MNKHELINLPFFKGIDLKRQEQLINQVCNLLVNKKVKLNETADFGYFHTGEYKLNEAYYMACRYLYSKIDVEPNLEPIITECSELIQKQLEIIYGYDYGIVNQLISDTISAFNKKAFDNREAYKKAKETQDTLKRFINDGRVLLSDLYIDSALDLYVFDAVFDYNPKKLEVYVKQVPCSELRDIPEALFMIFNNHPTKVANKLPSFDMRIDTLKKTHIATLRINPYSTWYRFKPSVVDAILADREGYVKVTSFNREAFITNHEFIDRYSVQIVDPELEN